MRLAVPADLGATVGACVASLMLLSAQPTSLPAFAEPPSADAQATLRKGYRAATEGLLPAADKLLSESIDEWQRTAQAPDETAALYKVRGTVRQQQGKSAAALSDLDQAVALLSSPSAKPTPAEAQRTYLQRARVNAALRRWPAAEADYTTAIARLDDLDAIEATNPYLYSERSAARSQLQQFGPAADDALTAAAEFKAIGDKLHALLASSDAALALYGSGDVPEALERMRTTYRRQPWRSNA